MSLSKKDLDTIKTIIHQSLDSRTHVSNQFKSQDMDRREGKLSEMVAFSEKSDDDGPPIGSYPPVAT